jgi:hypothetical protein
LPPNGRRSPQRAHFRPNFQRVPPLLHSHSPPTPPSPYSPPPSKAALGAVLEWSSRVLCELDLLSLAAEVLSTSKSIVPHDLSHLYVAEGDSVGARQWTRFGGDAPRDGVKIKSLAGIAADVALTGETVVTAGERDEDEVVTVRAARALPFVVCSPVMGGSGFVVGMIYFARGAGAFSDPDVEGVRAVATVLGAALRNALAVGVMRRKGGL